MRHYFNIDPQGSLSREERWVRNTELMIAIISVVFSFAILMLYKGGVNISESSRHAYIVQSVILAFPFLCLARLIYVRFRKPSPWFEWISPAVDILILSSIIYVFSLQYSNIAASFSAPTYAFYFVMIALHSMRFKPKQTLFCGLIATLSWGVMIAHFKFGGAEITHSYGEFIASSKLLLGAEIERMIALLTFSGFLAIAAQRARRLMSYEKEMEIEVAKINHQANISQVQFDEMQKTSKMKSDFLDTMSHEMRTPMNGVIGMIQVLDQTELTEKQRYMLNVMEKSSEAMLKIIQDILDFATLNGDDIVIKSEPFNFREVLDETLAELKQAAENKGLGFFLQIDPRLPDDIYGDAHYFALIIEKLTANAVKFTQKGYIRIHLEDMRDGSTPAKTGHMRVTIHDTGIGMSDNDKAAIFQAFSQADTSKSRAYGGMGIGLSLVQKLIHAIGSDIHFTSTLGKGTEIGFDLKWTAPETQPALSNSGDDNSSTPLKPAVDPKPTVTSGPPESPPIAAMPILTAPSSTAKAAAPPKTVDTPLGRLDEKNPNLDGEDFSDISDILHELTRDDAAAQAQPHMNPKKSA